MYVYSLAADLEAQSPHLQLIATEKLVVTSRGQIRPRVPLQIAPFSLGLIPTNIYRKMEM